jgi:tetratricopeptide (TPR) repeat protein
VLLLFSCNADTFEKKGDKAYALGEYYLAADYYRQAYSRTQNTERTKRGERALKMANCYSRYNHAQKAVGAYRNAVRYKVADSEAMLSYGRQLLKIGDYKAALKVFTELNDSMPGNLLVKNGLLSASNAPQWKKKGSDYTVKRMDVFNSRRDDYSPCLGGEDYDYLYFTSTRNDAIGDDLNANLPIRL